MLTAKGASAPVGFLALKVVNHAGVFKVPKAPFTSPKILTPDFGFVVAYIYNFVVKVLLKVKS